MRILVLLLALTAGCSRYFNPPCQQVAKAVCDVGGEGDSCAFVLNLKRDDARAQALCEQILPSAKAIAADPQGARAGWSEARGRLGELGFAPDPRKNRIEEKLKAAGGQAGRLVEKIEDAYEAGEKNRVDGAERALEGANQ